MLAEKQWAVTMENTSAFLMVQSSDLRSFDSSQFSGIRTTQRVIRKSSWINCELQELEHSNEYSFSSTKAVRLVILQSTNKRVN